MKKEPHMASFKKALRTYENNLSELLQDEGKYAVISDDKVCGTYEDFADALRAGYSTFGAGNFMVKEIQGQERIEMVTCGISLTCPA